MAARSRQGQDRRRGARPAGRLTFLVNTSDICRRMSNCSPARSRRISPASTENAEPDLIITAAKAAGVHDMIVSLPQGYDTEVGENGSTLSSGQQQRVGLARALYRDPFLVVLDEPNANLDSEGDEALTSAIAGVRKRGGIVVVVAHRPSAISAVDLILVMNKGRLHHFGPKEEALAKAAPRRACGAASGCR